MRDRLAVWLCGKIIRFVATDEYHERLERLTGQDFTDELVGALGRHSGGWRETPLQSMRTYAIDHATGTGVATHWRRACPWCIRIDAGEHPELTRLAAKAYRNQTLHLAEREAQQAKQS